MIPDHLTVDKYRIQADTKSFIDKVMMALLNLLGREGVDTREVEVLGTNDIYIFRGTSVVILTFSRSMSVLKPTYAERALAEVVSDESQTSLEEPIRFVNPVIDEYVIKGGFTDPVSVAFPISYLSREGEDLEEAHGKVASILVDPAKEDVDRKRRIVRVNPIFQGRDFLLEPDLCFVLMEFSDPYTDIYESLIKPTVLGEGFRCLKSDDIFATTSVIEDIWANINKASLVIAEISSNNPNVMYELGICHTVGKNVMMLTQSPDAIPFNFRHMRAYPYVNDIPGSDDLKKNIASVIQHVKAIQAA